MSKKILLTALVLGTFLSLGIVAQAATSSLTAAETVANVADVMDTTGLATSTTVANVTGLVKASTTLLFAAAPASSTPARYLTVGSCTIRFATTTAGISRLDGVSTKDESNCTDNLATVLLATTTADRTLTAAEIAQELRYLTGVTDDVNLHSALTVGGTGAYVTLQTTGLEASSSLIHIIDGTGTVGSQFSTTTSLAGVMKKTQTETITVGGTISTNNIYTLRSDGITAHYTALSTDSTTANIATGLNTAITAASPTEYANTVLSNVITLAATTAGTAFDPATTTVARAQTVTFTPATVTEGESFIIYINDTRYLYQANSTDGVSQVVAGLASAMSVDLVATCTVSGSAVSCVAKTAGTAFTYSTSVLSASPANSGGNSGSAGGAPTVIIKPVLPVPILSPSAPIVLTRAWSYGKTHKEIKLLQQFLNNHGFLVAKKGAGSPGRETTYFGKATKNALIKFQRANKIKPYNGVLNTKTRALLNSL